MTCKLLRGVPVQCTIIPSKTASEIRVYQNRNNLTSPPCILTRFFKRSIKLRVPSAFHCPMSPVLNHPSPGKMLLSSFKSGLLKYPFVTAGPLIQTSPCWCFSDAPIVEPFPFSVEDDLLTSVKYPRSGQSTNLISTEGAGIPTGPKESISGGR